MCNTNLSYAPSSNSVITPAMALFNYLSAAARYESRIIETEYIMFDQKNSILFHVLHVLSCDPVLSQAIVYVTL